MHTTLPLPVLVKYGAGVERKPLPLGNPLSKFDSADLWVRFVAGPFEFNFNLVFPVLFVALTVVSPDSH